MAPLPACCSWHGVLPLLQKCPLQAWHLHQAVLLWTLLPAAHCVDY